MKVVRHPSELEARERPVAIGTFDGVHRGHRRVIETALAEGPATIVTFEPHPRLALGYGVELLSTLERRLELFAELGADETVVIEFTHELQQLEPEDFAERVLRPLGASPVVAGEDFRFGHRRRGDLELLRSLGFEVEVVPLVDGISSTDIREHLREGRIEAFLLNFEGDLYGQRLVVELWSRLRDERAFENEQELIDQIARDVEKTRRAARPSDLT